MSIEESLAKLHSDVDGIYTKYEAFRTEINRMKQMGISMGHTTEDDLINKYAAELSGVLLGYIRDTKQFLSPNDSH